MKEHTSIQVVRYRLSTTVITDIGSSRIESGAVVRSIPIMTWLNTENFNRSLFITTFTLISRQAASWQTQQFISRRFQAAESQPEISVTVLGSTDAPGRQSTSIAEIYHIWDDGIHTDGGDPSHYRSLTLIKCLYPLPVPKVSIVSSVYDWRWF